MDFNSREIFTRVNKIEAMYERLRVNVKVKPRLTFMFTRDTSYIASILFTRYLKYPRFFSRERLVSGTRRIYMRSRTYERKKYATVGIFLDKSNELQYCWFSVSRQSK